MRIGQVAVGTIVALCCVGTVTGQTEWVDEPASPVILPPGDAGDWDDGFRVPLAVIKVEDVYHIYFNGQPEGSPQFLDYQIGHAWSLDGVDWNMDPENPVLPFGPPGAWDDTSLWGAAVIQDGPELKLYYCGAHGDFKRVGLATNYDPWGPWTRFPGNPVMDVGPPGSFDEKEVKPTSMIVRDGRYQMWYAGATAWNVPATQWDWQIGYAESEDGITWTGRRRVLGPGDDWESQFVVGASVLFDGVIFRMWYTGGHASSFSIGYALSLDGVRWTKFSGNPVIAAPVGQGYEFSRVLLGDTTDYVMWYHDMVPDTIRRAISDCCGVAVFFNGFESGGLTAWSGVGP